MGKIGRNQLCTCGSGRKYKHCHGSFSPAIEAPFQPKLRVVIEERPREVDALERRRLQQQGLGRPIISDQVAGQRVVAVGGRLYQSTKWHTFHDFLRDYLLESLGQEWVNAEQAKPLEKRHPILRWYAQAAEQATALPVAHGKIVRAPMTGAMRSFLNLAYNIYLIAHHGEGQVMADIYLRRLRSARADDFTGALFETYAAAAFLKAGFKLAYEEISHRSTSCVEFVATWPKSGEHFSVEVKARLHGGGGARSVDDSDEVRRLRIGAKLTKALSKAADHMRVVMIEVNVPDHLTGVERLEGWSAAAVSQIRTNEKAVKPDGSLYPPAYVFLTNHAFHHDLAGTEGVMQMVADGFRIPDFGPDARYRGYAEVLAARERHAAMMSLISSMGTHYEIPATFGGELPGTMIAPGAIHRLRIGCRYMVPDGTGGEVPAVLASATVLEPGGLVYGVYKLDSGRHIICTNPLTPEELEDYIRYPDTFFDEVTPLVSKAKTFVEKCDFLFGVYQHSAREVLLEFMADSAEIEHLRTLGQRDLAIIYSERIAQAMQSDEDASTTAQGIP